MKSLKLNILIFLLLFPLHLLSQTDTTITSLSGFEDNAGITHLFYGTHYSNLDKAIDTSLSNIYYLNTSTKYNNIFLHGETHTQILTLPPFGTDGKIITGLTFFNNDTSQYIYIQKSGISLSENKIIKSGVGEVLSTSENIRFLFISKQNSNNVYAVLDSVIIKSTDAGNTWPDITDTENIAIDFTPLVFSPFDENIIFGFDYYKRLVKSLDGGKHSFVVQPENIWDEKSQICFDANQKNIYAAVSLDYNAYLLESQNKGDPYTWESLAWFDGRIILKVDAENSGTFYYHFRNNLVCTNNYGATFDTLFTCNGAVTDFYKQSGQNNFYVAYSNRIEKFSSNNSEILKSFPIKNTLALFPLNVGNKWVYHEQGWWVGDTFPEYFDYYSVASITSDSIIDGHRCYHFSGNIGVGSNWMRIDSTTGMIYSRYDNAYCEFTYIDLLAPENSSFETSAPWIVNDVIVSDTTLWGKRRLRKDYSLLSLSTVELDYLQGIGVSYQRDEFDFGVANTYLQGAVIDGIVYGDTIVVGVSEDDLSLPKKYKLYQNYPNPFNPSTTIKYSIPNVGNENFRSVQLKVYDILGREVAVLVNEKQSPGNYEVTFDASNLPSGVYIYRIVTSDFLASRKMILLK